MVLSCPNKSILSPVNFLNKMKNIRQHRRYSASTVVLSQMCVCYILLFFFVVVFWFMEHFSFFNKSSKQFQTQLIHRYLCTTQFIFPYHVIL